MTPQRWLVAGLEFAGIFLAFFVGVYIRFLGDLDAGEASIGHLLPRALLFAGIFMIALVSVGLYRTDQGGSFSDTLVRLLTATLLTTVIHALIYYWLPDTFTGRGPLALALLTASLVVALCRLFGRSSITKAFQRDVLILGSGQAAAYTIKAFSNRQPYKYRLAGFIGGAGDVTCEECVPRVERPRALLDFVRENNIDEIVIAVDDRRKFFPARELLECRLGGVKVSDALTFIERETGKIHLDVLTASWLIYGQGFHRNTLHQALKRLADILASLLLIILAAPLLMAAVLAITIESRGRGGILYRQRRVGLHGKPFDLLKLRSMIPEAEADGQARWAATEDTRVTSVGALLRRFRIDELPQVVNILRGEMSFVGPRPERPEFVAELTSVIPYYYARHSVKPGLTGWAQLCFPYGASVQDAKEKLEYDLYYVKHQTPMFDLLIILQTLEVVIWERKRTRVVPTTVASAASAGDASRAA